MTTTPRPMRAWNKSWSLSDLLFPLTASPKINGERGLVYNRSIISSRGKRISNIHIQSAFHSISAPLDGELIAGTNPCVPGIRRLTRSVVGSRYSLTPWSYLIFDRWDRGNAPFQSSTLIQPWFGTIPSFIQSAIATNFFHVPQFFIPDLDALLSLQQVVIDSGFEGLIIRSPGQPYKHGRCTLEEYHSGRGMLKLKNHETSEAIVIGTYPMRRNGNPAAQDPLGYMDRSTNASCMFTDLTLLGGLIARPLDPRWADSTLRIGGATEGGWDEAERKALMAQASTLPGRLFTFRYFPEGDPDTLPAQAKFVSWRSPSDL